MTQAFALEGARSIITLNATRKSKGRRQSRILWSYARSTIPRHLRDVFITEYGVADLRGKSDRDCIAAMLEIADSEFQEGLLGQARDAGKIEAAYQLPKDRRNSSGAVSHALREARAGGHCRSFPFGTDFTPVEQKLLPALSLLKERTATRSGMAGAFLSAMTAGAARGNHEEELARMKLGRAGFRERVYSRLLTWALEQAGPKGASR